MTRAQKTYGQVALLMAGILAASILLTLLASGGRPTATGNKQVVTSFYPMTVAVLNLTDGVEGIEVVSLTGSTTGCLHDYQLSPDNRITLSSAFLLVLNGAGAESFLDGVLDEMPDLPVIDTSVGISLLAAGETELHDAEDGHQHSLHNEHIWTSPDRYAKQVENLRDGLCRYDPEHAEQYRQNATAYLEEIHTIGEQLRQAAAALPIRTCVIFHDSLAYLSQDWGLEVAVSLSMGEEAGVSAGDLAEAERQAAAAGEILLLYDSQYSVEYAYIADSADDHAILTLNTAVSGPVSRTAWLDAMQYNLDQLRQLGGTRS